MRDYVTTVMNAIVNGATVCTCVCTCSRFAYVSHGALEMAVDMYSARWQRGFLIVAAMFIEYVCSVGGVWPSVRARC